MRLSVLPKRATEGSANALERWSDLFNSQAAADLRVRWGLADPGRAPAHHGDDPADDENHPVDFLLPYVSYP
jgi:hypothetical protein